MDQHKLLRALITVLLRKSERLMDDSGLLSCKQVGGFVPLNKYRCRNHEVYVSNLVGCILQINLLKNADDDVETATHEMPALAGT